MISPDGGWTSEEHLPTRSPDGHGVRRAGRYAARTRPVAGRYAARGGPAWFHSGPRTANELTYHVCGKSQLFQPGLVSFLE